MQRESLRFTTPISSQCPSETQSTVLLGRFEGRRREVLSIGQKFRSDVLVIAAVRLFATSVSCPFRTGRSSVVEGAAELDRR